MMSVEGLPTGIDDALKRYALGVDGRTETMRSLKDVRGGSEEYHARRESLWVCAGFFVFPLIFVSVTRFFKVSN
jgi:hypothetical protein